MYEQIQGEEQQKGTKTQKLLSWMLANYERNICALSQCLHGSYTEATRIFIEMKAFLVVKAFETHEVPKALAAFCLGMREGAFRKISSLFTLPTNV